MSAGGFSCFWRQANSSIVRSGELNYALAYRGVPPHAPRVFSVRIRRSRPPSCSDPPLAQEAGEPPDPLGEADRLGEEREDEEIVGREVKEKTGMDEDSGAREQIEDQLLVGAPAGDAEDGRPPSLRREELDSGEAGQRLAERGVVDTQPREDAGTDRRRQGQHSRERPLHRRRYREIAVGHHL